LASSLFLIGAAMLYGVTGTLNMADLALKIPLVPEADRGLLHAGAAILAMAFLAKAGMWPLNFWLVPAYSSASAPVAALFAIMTKVGCTPCCACGPAVLRAGRRLGELRRRLAGVWRHGDLAVAAVAILAAQRLERMAA
jgi:multicomponent K+:H+ antiporter subunit D